MMPDLGKYAGSVMGAYGASIALLVLLVVVSLWQASRMKRALAEVEERTKPGPSADAAEGESADV